MPPAPPPGVIRKLLDVALTATGLTDTGGRPFRFVPHDFRRIFITNAVMNGMPTHIAQLVVGHHDFNTTMGYKRRSTRRKPSTVHQTFITRRRTLRPSKEYRTPPMRSGSSSSATSNDAESRQAPADMRSGTTSSLRSVALS